MLCPPIFHPPRLILTFKVSIFLLYHHHGIWSFCKIFLIHKSDGKVWVISVILKSLIISHHLYKIGSTTRQAPISILVLSIIGYDINYLTAGGHTTTPSTRPFHCPKMCETSMPPNYPQIRTHASVGRSVGRVVELGGRENHYDHVSVIPWLQSSEW